jgi:hypothetical protein
VQHIFHLIQTVPDTSLGLIVHRSDHLASKLRFVSARIKMASIRFEMVFEDLDTGLKTFGKLD